MAIDENRLIKKLITKIRNILSVVLQIPVNEIKIRTPVDTGYLRNSINGELVTVSETEYIIVLTAAYGDEPVEYAFWVEFGTSKMPPAAMFRRGIEAAVPKMNKALGDALYETAVELSEQIEL